MKKTLIFLSAIVSVQCYSQTKSDTSNLKDKALNVFLDCNYCDMDFLRTEIPIVNYVRDRKEADVDIVASSIQTGSGGEEFTFVFLGQGRFAGQTDTLKTNTTSFVTDDGERKTITQTLKLGLARYIAKTAFSNKINISFTKDTVHASTDVNVAPALDKWKSWVFTISMYGNINKQQLTNQLLGAPSFTISKVTPGWKINLNYNIFYQDNKYIVSDSTIHTILRTEAFNGVYVKSLGEHFSATLFGTIVSSTANNFDLQTKVGPGVEYSVFPYVQSTHRNLRFIYSIYDVNNKYIDTTIFDKVKQQVPAESFTIYSQYKEPWGSLQAQVTGAQYFYDLSKYEVNMSLSVTLNLFEGFSINIYANSSIIHDQIYLPAAGPTSTDILLGLQTLATTYQYGTGIQLTYTFGSIYNNIVNPRFNTLLPFISQN